MFELLIKNISKKINSQIILENLNCKFENKITGLVGLNGSGKTTLLKIISGLLKADEGGIIFSGIECNVNSGNWRKKIGYLSQNPSLYERMSVFSFLDYMLILSDWRDNKIRTRRIQEICNLLKLSPYLQKNIGQLSGGIKQKVAIAQAVIHDPPILLLDEPANNLDNDERENLHKYLLNISDKKIVLVVEHILDELPVFCERILVLKDGRFLFDGGPDGLIELNKNHIREIIIPKEKYFPNALNLGLISFRSFNGSIVLRVDTRLSEIKEGNKVMPSFSEAVRITYNSTEI